MKTLAEHFSNQSFGEMVVTARIAALKELIAFQAKRLGQDYTSVVGANGNLRLRLRLLCTAPSCVCGNGFWPCIT
jgi:hypothetical protein